MRSNNALFSCLILRGLQIIIMFHFFFPLFYSEIFKFESVDDDGQTTDG